tara:strand:- start:1789 stop:2886 length:1098 start_codon:yes stop_codon:yes gene_type:complete
MKPLTYDEFCKLEVNHIAHGSQHNNRVENLEVITKKANLQHAQCNPNRKSNANAMSKPILGKRKCDDNWREFASAKEAARILSKQEGKTFYKEKICAVCKKREKSHKGFEFQYRIQPDLDGEVWKVNPFLNIKCSNMGRVETTRGIKTFGSRSAAYFKVGIRRKNYPVHRVVAQAFHWDIVEKMYNSSDFAGNILAFWKTLHVDHVNFTKHDNRACNLVPTLAKVNIARQPPNKKSHAAAQSKPIKGRKLGANSEWITYPSIAEAARVLGLNSGCVSSVCLGKMNRTGNYTFRFIKDEDLQGEIWKPIPEALFPGKKVKGMMASNKGRILTKCGVKTYGTPAKGYLACCYLKVHRLVAASFLCGY